MGQWPSHKHPLLLLGIRRFLFLLLCVEHMSILLIPDNHNHHLGNFPAPAFLWEITWYLVEKAASSVAVLILQIDTVKHEGCSCWWVVISAFLLYHQSPLRSPSHHDRSDHLSNWETWTMCVSSPPPFPTLPTSRQRWPWSWVSYEFSHCCQDPDKCWLKS